MFKIVLVEESLSKPGPVSHQLHLRGTHKLNGPDVAQYVPVPAHRGKRKFPSDDYSCGTTRKQIETHLKDVKRATTYPTRRSQGTWKISMAGYGGIDAVDCVDCHILIFVQRSCGVGGS